MSASEQFTLRESTADGWVRMTLENMRRTTIEIDRDIFENYSLNDIENTSAILMDRLWNSAFAQRRANLEARGFDPRSERRPHWDPRVRRADEYLASVECEGESIDCGVIIRAKGFRSFNVELDPGVEHLDVAELIAEFHSAERDLMADWVAVRAEVKREAYGWAT